jgi:hypothetical protein
MSKSSRKPSHDPSVFCEPHLASSEPPSEPTSIDPPAPIAPEFLPEADVDVDHSVWDEPMLSPELVGETSADRLTFANWLDTNIARTSWAKSMWVTLGLILVAGPFGILGAFMGGGDAGLAAGGLVAVVIIGPVTEEIVKVALTLWVAERRPYLFKRIWQILLASAAGGLLFGFIENLIYLNVYIPNASAALADFRWSVCLGLHVNCSFIAGVGIARMWNHTMQSRVRPDINMALPWIGIAVAGHGLYNLTVTLLELGGVLNLE